ncbi:hypothetical protein F4808DRAFT_241639 [Astrocystis sublimbata]|nr:hypothetical protein F4808DRAFT_241639 [Astrocystis sublimbata]
MSHTQPSLAQRQFSPPQAPSPSPNNATSAGFPLPPSKRTKVSPAPPHSQPASPYGHGTPYAASPASGPPTPVPAPVLASPSLPTSMASAALTPTAQVPQGSYNPSHQTNGRFTPMAPAQPPMAQSPVPVPSQPPTPSMHQPYQHSVQSPQPYPAAQSPHPTPTPIPIPNNAHLQSPYGHSQAQLVPSPATPTAATGNMGPPTIHPSTSFSNANDGARQPARPAPKTTAYDMNDMLMGTGIDLEEEAEYMNNLESRAGYPHLPPGTSASFYGAGPANQPAELVDGKTPEDWLAIEADSIWNSAAQRLAVTRSQEIRHYLLEPGLLHKRMHEVSQKFGLGLNLDLKPDGRNQPLGKFSQPADFPKPELRFKTVNGPEAKSATVQVTGSFIPKESYLVDQIALLSIGTKERLKDLLGDANNIAKTRQKSSHGVVPLEWADAAASSAAKPNGVHAEDTRTGAGSAVSPRTNPLKRPRDEISNNGLPTPVSETPPSNPIVDSMLELVKQTQSAEEGRLKKRQKRLEKLAEKEKEGADAGSRSGSVAPGTPGLMAPDGGETKTLSKKEGKKAAAKAAESSSGTTVNATLSLFTGGKKKKYSWMSAGGSGAATPKAPGTPGASAGTGSSAASRRGPLTKAGVSHLGQLREDLEKGKRIQLRDWIVVLEDQGMDPRSLQALYGNVDKSDQGDKMATDTA